MIDWESTQRSDNSINAVVEWIKEGKPDDLCSWFTTWSLEQKALYSARDQFCLRDSLLYYKEMNSEEPDVLYQFVVPPSKRASAMDACHRDAGLR